MFPIYLTPASISYLNQFLLALLIAFYLGMRLIRTKRQPGNRQDCLLTIFFSLTALFSALFFLEVSFLPTERLYVVYLENSVLGLLLVVLIQFAYEFPVPQDKQKWERFVALLLSGAYFLWEAGFAVWRFQLLQSGQVEFRHNYMDIPVALEFLWVIILFTRSSIQNWNLPSSRRFALVFVIPFWLAMLNILRSYYAVSTTFYHINLSIGILFTIFLFALIYLTSQPEQISFIDKLSGAVLTGVLAVFGTIAWLVAPAYAAQYSPSIIDQRTIRFSPNENGGYDVSETLFHFESDLGKSLNIFDETNNADRQIYETAFEFPFFGESYKTIYISNDGAIGIGGQFTWRDFQYRFARVPMIFPLLVDLNPGLCDGCGVFLRQETDRLIITYYRIPSYNHPKAVYTFQVFLYPNGVFEFTYNGLPELTFYVDDRPESTAWVIGAKPARAPRESASFLNLPVQSDQGGILQDEYRSFRMYLHNFMLPLAIAITISGLLFLSMLPLTLKFSFARPLDALLKGVETLNRGQYNASLHVQSNDEIGFLTESFNRLSGELNNLISDLEIRVAERTSALRESEERYRQLFNLESDAILIIRNSDGQILETNNAAAELYGFSHRELLSMKNTDLSAEPEATRQATNTPAPSDTVVKIPLRWHRKKDGTRFPVGITARFVTWKGESVHLAAIRDITEQHQAEQELMHLAITDPLTSLPNRRHFLTQAENHFTRANQPPYSLALMMLDMDNFKNINDQYGHTAGDQALCEAARILAGNLRSIDLLARMGGEEFAILLPRTPKTEARRIGERLCRALAETPIRVENHEVRLTVSIGVAALDETVHTLDEFLRRADQALYLAKEAGRNRCEIWTGA